MDLEYQVGGRLRTLRQELKATSLSESALERDLVAEVVEITTELLMSRATRENDVIVGVDVSAERGGGGEITGPWLWEGKARDAGTESYDRIEEFLVFLDEAFPYRQEEKVEVPSVIMKVEIRWASELQRIEKMRLEEEQNREAAAREIEYLLKYEYGMWPDCKVEVFDSSKSLCGSPNSDLDMCILTKGPCRGSRLSTELLGFYYLKRLMERKVWDEDREGMTTAERIVQLKKAQSKVTEAVNRQKATIFNIQMHLLIDALSSKLDQLYWEARSRRGAIKTPRTALNEKMLRTSKHRKNELFDLKSILESEGYDIQAIASHARVPVIRFRNTRSGLDYRCDLTLDNELGVRNTRLLRTYASCDERGRDLGVTVKHWAKERGITDTASGFLSSYSYVLLTIYYLQVVHVLPNLQDPRLLELAEVPAEYYDGVSVGFGKIVRSQPFSRNKLQLRVNWRTRWMQHYRLCWWVSSSSMPHSLTISIMLWQFDRPRLRC